MQRKIIGVVGATGSQGGGVVDALVREGTFRVRAITRNPAKYTGSADEVVQGDLSDLDSLTKAFEDTHGVFVVTNFWEGADEIAQGQTAIQAAGDAGVNHFIWSTLPDVENISKGVFEVPHFTGKAKLDAHVENAKFENYTFVHAPFYYQNLIGVMAPQPKEDGSIGWTLPMDPSKKVIHMADINDLGKVVAGAFLNPHKVGDGSYLSLSAELNSFNDVVEAFRANGKDCTVNQVPAEVFATFFEGAEELAQMMAYFEAHTYMGPDADHRIQLAGEVATGDFISLKAWISQNIKA